MAVYMVLLLGMTLGGGQALSIDGDNSKLLAVLNSSTSALDLLIHIKVLSDDSAPLSTTVSPLSLESIIRAEISGDWDRALSVLQLASQARTLELKHAIYEALWLELQQTKHIYDPIKLLDFYEQLENHMPDVPPALLDEIYKTFTSRSAQLLSSPFHTSSRSANFPLVDKLLERLTFSILDYLRDILHSLYDVVLSLESTLSVVQQLGNFSANLTQLTLANLELLKRTELELDLVAQEALQDNLHELLEQPNFDTDVEQFMRLEVYEQLPSNERVLYTAEKVCLRNGTNDNSYIYECPQTYLICTSAFDPKKAAFHVQRGQGGANNSLQFAFNSVYWSNRYMFMESVNQMAPNSIIKNVFSRDTIYWWQVVEVQGGGIALYDAATAESVLCGGDPKRWDGEEHHVYTRRAQDFATYHWECTWNIEDCSDVDLK